MSFVERFHLVKQLLNNKKNNITVIDNLSSDKEKYCDRLNEFGVNINNLVLNGEYEVNKMFNVKILDIKNYEKLKDLFFENNFDVVINLAAIPGVLKAELEPFESFDNNVMGFNNIVKLCEKYEVKHLLYASSSCVYGDAYYKTEEYDKLEPKSYYGYTKLNNELICKTIVKTETNKLKISGLRFFNVYGEQARKDMAFNLFISKIKEDCGITLYNNGENSRDLIYVGDVINAITLIMNSQKEYDHEIFNIGSGKTITILNYYKLLKKNIKKRTQ